MRFRTRHGYEIEYERELVGVLSTIGVRLRYGWGACSTRDGSCQAIRRNGGTCAPRGRSRARPGLVRIGYGPFGFGQVDVVALVRGSRPADVGRGGGRGPALINTVR